VSTDERLLHYGRRAWAVVGLGLAAAALLLIGERLRHVLVPVLLALFPAALLSPLAERLRATRLPDALSAVLLVVGLLLVVVVPAWFIAPLFAAQLPALVASVSQVLDELRGAFDWSRLPGSPEGPRDLIERGLDDVVDGGVMDQGLAAATSVVTTLAGLALMLVTVFFLLKDPIRIGNALLEVVPRRFRRDAAQLGSVAWWTLGAYLRGQLIVALVDAVFIGLGLWVLDVPLALPLAVLVFFGGLFPIVGAFVSGLIAVLVALADEGLLTAALTLALIVVVQQLEGNLLQPVILGSIVALHPLVIILAVTAGGYLLGILGAFLAVPLTAIAARIIDHVRGRDIAAGPDRPDTEPEPQRATAE
jgi:predicted PurR-regulated permease PerM